MSKNLKLNNCILIAGSGRNVGKTTLACHVIEQLSAKGIEVVAFKVSNHKHVVDELIEPVMNRADIFIGREMNPDSAKDSSRYIRAGASQSFFVQLNDQSINYLMDSIRSSFSADCVVVIESALFSTSIEPGLAFFVKQKAGGKVCSWPFEHYTLPAIEDEQDQYWPSVDWVNTNWEIRNGVRV